MCFGFEFAQHPKRMTRREWNRRLGRTGSGSDGFVYSSALAVDMVQIHFSDPHPALLVDGETDLWLPWGRKAEEPGDWPMGGSVREEALRTQEWRRWNPQPLTIYPQRWLEKDRHAESRWFDLEPGFGIGCVVLTTAPGTPMYVITVPSEGVYRMEIQDRIPVVA